MGLGDLGLDDVGGRGDSGMRGLGNSVTRGREDAKRENVGTRGCGRYILEEVINKQRRIFALNL